MLCTYMYVLQGSSCIREEALIIFQKAPKQKSSATNLLPLINNWTKTVLLSWIYFLKVLPFDYIWIIHVIKYLKTKKNIFIVLKCLQIIFYRKCFSHFTFSSTLIFFINCLRDQIFDGVIWQQQFISRHVNDGHTTLKNELRRKKKI